MEKDKKELVEQALLRRAVGYDATETVEEFAECEGEIRLVKRRISTKNVPPDVSAAKMVMEECGRDFCRLDDRELAEEKQRLLRLLKESDDETTD